MSMHMKLDQVGSSRRRGARFGRLAVRVGLAMATIAFVTSCTNKQTQGTSAVYLTIDSLLGASGASPDKFSGSVASDVQTNQSIIADNGQVTLRSVLKDPGSVSNPATPSPANLITITRFRVHFVRSDGRDRQGIDVPYDFDGGLTFTALPAGSTGNFTLVRIQAKLEAPLLALRALGGAVTISTIAEITFYGADQAGRPVSVTGNISVNFADWADPATSSASGN